MCSSDLTGHPETGLRHVADEMTHFLQRTVIPKGGDPSMWSAYDFESILQPFVDELTVRAKAGSNSVQVEFPHVGDASSSCWMGVHDHKLYGGGLATDQTFRCEGATDLLGTLIASKLNELQFTRHGMGYGFGSWSYDSQMVVFTSFTPNTLFNEAMLQNMFLSCSYRAEFMRSVFEKHGKMGWGYISTGRFDEI